MSEIQGLNPSTGTAGAEASLDVEWVMAVAQGIPSVLISIDASSSTPFLDWAVAALDDANTASVHSVSWGTPEYEYEDEVGVDRLNVELAKFAALGVSVLFASGDNGAGCHDGAYMPNYPASSPYVTAVGGTWIPPLTSTFAIEGDEISGGGFATSPGNNRSLAPWQEDVVLAYQASRACPSSKYYTSSGRGVPDVAAFSAYYNIIRNGDADQVDGTSASAPVWAAMIALINDARLNAGLPTMGFLNPFLYSMGSGGASDAIVDITTGTNNFGGCLRTGFEATEGWDAVTGLGVPNFQELLKEAMAAGARAPSGRSI